MAKKKPTGRVQTEEIKDGTIWKWKKLGGPKNPKRGTSRYMLDGTIHLPANAVIPERLVGTADGGGLRHNTDKDRWDLLPTDAVEQVVKVLTLGARKYASRNWERGMPWSVCQASLARHLAAWAQGGRRDLETALPHMAHVATNALFLLAYELRGMGHLDDVEPYLRGARAKKEARP